MTDDKKQQLKLMDDAVKKIKKMVKDRMTQREAALPAYEPSSLEQLPDAVKISREHDASNLKSVIQEQKDLLTILDFMYPDV